MPKGTYLSIFLSFSSLSFYSSRHVDSREKLVEYQRAHNHHHHKSRRSSTNETTTASPVINNVGVVGREVEGNRI